MGVDFERERLGTGRQEQEEGKKSPLSALMWVPGNTPTLESSELV